VAVFHLVIAENT